MTDTIGGNAKEQLKSIVDRIENLEQQRAELADDVKEIYAEAKSSGLDTKTIRKVLKLRKQDANKREEEEALLELYMSALGMLADTELGQAAIARATG